MLDALVKTKNDPVDEVMDEKSGLRGSSNSSRKILLMFDVTVHQAEAVGSRVVRRRRSQVERSFVL